MLTGGGISNTSLNNEVYPLMQYLIDQEIPITYYYSNTDEKQVATKKQFDVLQEKLTSTLTKIQNAYQNLVG
jgi:NAD(P)H-flavin reductase